MQGWIGVDLDGTIAEYHGWQGDTHIGPPIPAMIERVKQWLAEGKQVKIFTARVNVRDGECLTAFNGALQNWLHSAGLPTLDVTCCKDFQMIELWDDRCVQVVPNTGQPVVELHKALASA